jgi:23S rRNA pseudouridine2605 synthase
MAKTSPGSPDKYGGKKTFQKKDKPDYESKKRTDKSPDASFKKSYDKPSPYPKRGEKSDQPFSEYRKNAKPSGKRRFEKDSGERSERPKRNFDDKKPFERRDDGRPGKPKREFSSDRPKRNFDDKKPFEKRDDSRTDRPKREFSSDRPKRNFDDKKPFERRDDGRSDRPKREFSSDRPKRNFDDKKPFEKRDEGRSDRPKRNFDDKKPFEKRDNDRSDRPKREFSTDRPKRNFDGKKPFEKPARKDSDKPSSEKKRDTRPFRERNPFVENDGEPREKVANEVTFTKELPTEGSKVKKPFESKKLESKKIAAKQKADTPLKSKRKRKDEDWDDEGEEDETPEKAEQMPLNKYIAHSGECSRRDAAELVKQGKVKVNGELVLDPGQKINPGDIVTLVGKKLTPQKGMLYILLNKPKGYITTNDDPQGRRTVMELVAGIADARLFPVGRLDRNTTGLLLITNDGDLAQKLAHPSHKIKKVYHVTLDKPLTKAHFEKIMAGLELEDGVVNVDALAYLEAKNELGLEIHSGRNRIVRRIFESLDYVVEKLDRVMYAGFTKKNIPRGKWRQLDPREIVLLKHFKN